MQKCISLADVLFSSHQIVAVASVKGLGHKLPNLLVNLCPSPFTLATTAANRWRH